jgi:hypothetical protein
MAHMLNNSHSSWQAPFGYSLEWLYKGISSLDLLVTKPFCAFPCCAISSAAGWGGWGKAVTRIYIHMVDDKVTR